MNAALAHQLFTKKARVISQIGRQEQISGHRRECEVLRVILYLAEKCQWEWFVGARICTDNEDQHGIDIVVETSDIGKLFFQVKSSYAGAIKSQNKRRSAHIATIIASNNYSAAKLSYKITDAVLKERNDILALRNSQA